MISHSPATDPELVRYWELYPLVAHLSKCRCPVHRDTWIFVDELAKEATCYQCAKTYTIADLIAWKEAHPTAPRRRSEAQRCPLCQRTLKASRQGLYGCVCGWEGTLQDIEEAEARRLMEEAPLGARPYHRPRHG